MIQRMILAALIVLVSLPILQAQSMTEGPALSFRAPEAGHGDAAYQRGLSALDARNWDRAAGFFEESASRKGGDADAALYWLAYAQNKGGYREKALRTLQQLVQAFPASRWTNDANALEVEIHSQNGNSVSPSDEPDEELKLLALNGLISSEPDKALPILRKILSSNNSDRLKDRAMFVLVQNRSPEARKLVGDMARGSNNLGLQLKAIRYMGMIGGDESRKELASVYAASASEDVKRAVLKSFMTSDSRGLLLNVAKTETNPELRHEAIRQLALAGGKDQLWQLYEQETSLDNKKAILQSFFLTGDSQRLADLARSAKEPDLRIAAITSLGLIPNSVRSEVLVSIYQLNHDPEIRRAVLKALFLQHDGKAMVDLARAEKDPRMKEEIVKNLALIHTKESSDYIMEILK